MGSTLICYICEALGHFLVTQSKKVVGMRARSWQHMQAKKLKSFPKVHCPLLNTGPNCTVDFRHEGEDILEGHPNLQHKVNPNN